MSQNKKYAFLFNPTANRDRAQDRLEWLRLKTSEYWPNSEIFMSSGRADLHRRAYEAARVYDVVVACGGDGTVNEVFNAGFGGKATLAVLPMGSGNDFAKALGISVKSDVAIEQLRNSETVSVDVVKYTAGDRSAIMMNTMGIGFDGLVNYEASKIKRIKGPLIYILAALKGIIKHKYANFTMMVDGVPVTEQLLMLTLANGQVEGGNFHIAPKAKLDDGILEVISVPPMSRLNLLLHLPLFLYGKQHLSKKIRHRRARKLSIALDHPLPVHVDGEQVGLDISSISLEVIPASMKVLKPVV